MCEEVSLHVCVCAHVESQGWGQESSPTTHFISIIDGGRVSRANPVLPNKVSFPVKLACLYLPRLELQAGLHARLAFKWIPGDLNSGPMLAWQALHRWSISLDPVIPNNTHLPNVAQGGNSQWKTLGWLMCDSEAFSMSLNLGDGHDLLWPGKHEKSQSLPILPCSLSGRVLPLALLDPAFPWEQSRISLLKNEKSRRAKSRHVSHGHNQSHPSKTCQLTTNTFWAQIKEPTPDPDYQHLFTLPEKDKQDGTLINTSRSVPAFLQHYSGNSQHSKTLNPFPISISFSLPRYGDSEALSELGWISAWWEQATPFW